MSVRRLSLALLTLLPLLTAGCGKPDLQEFADNYLRKNRLVGVETTDAVKFLENGGLYYDDPSDPETTRLDAHVLPLLKRIRDELKLEPLVTYRKDAPKQGRDLIIRLPASKAEQDRLQKVIDEAQAAFPGEIFQQWGHEYLALELFDQEEAAWYAESEKEDMRLADVPESVMKVAKEKLPGIEFDRAWKMPTGNYKVAGMSKAGEASNRKFRDIQIKPNGEVVEIDGAH